MPGPLLVAIAIVVCFIALGGAGALAQQQPKSESPLKSGQPVLFKADQVQYDRDLGVVVARGHVERHPAQGVDRRLAHRIVAAQAARLEDERGVVHDAVPPLPGRPARRSAWLTPPPPRAA